MSFSKKVFRVRNKKTGEFVALGYDNKTSWLTFPSQAIKFSPHLINEKTKDDFEVEEYSLVLSKKYTTDKKEIEE